MIVHISPDAERSQKVRTGPPPFSAMRGQATAALAAFTTPGSMFRNTFRYDIETIKWDIKYWCLFSKLAARMGAYIHGACIHGMLITDVILW